MDWFVALFTGHSIAHAVIVLALVVATGLALGAVRIRGLSLGVGGVLFAGLAFGHFGMTIELELMEFIREFGLILFVYAVGLQVGPGFVSSLRRQGLWLNLFAAAIVLGGTLTALLIAFLAGIELPAAVGMLSGAVTNTPSLGAAQQALGEVGVAADAIQMVGLGYAVAYPFGILGIILTMLLVRRIFRVDVVRESEEFERLNTGRVAPLLTKDVLITNPNLDGKTVQQVLDMTASKVVLSRLFREGRQEVPTPDTLLHTGDVVHAVGTDRGIENFRTLVGRDSEIALPAMPAPIVVARVVVTRTEHVGRALGDLDLDIRHGVAITRVVRSGVEFTPTRGMRLQLGDRLVVVGRQEGVDLAAQDLGNQVQELDRPHILSVFLGISLGVLVGSIPLAMPGVPAPVRLGLAGGPLLVAIILGRIGRIGPFVTYLPNPAKKLLGEFGIALFLGCVGLKSGERFVEILRTGDGLMWMGLAALITLVPLLIVGFTARIWKRLNYISLCGLLSGSMTDPPALAYATQMVGNDSPSIAYATVYPLTMLMRVVLAQLIVLFLA